MNRNDLIRTAAQRTDDADLRSQVIRLAHENPGPLRDALLDVLAAEQYEACEACQAEMDEEVMAGRTWGNPDPNSRPDDNVPYNAHPNSPPAGADGSAQRKKYNQWFRNNVCPAHRTTCGDPSLAK